MLTLKSIIESEDIFMKVTYRDAERLSREELIQEIIETNCGYSSDQLDDYDTDTIRRIWVNVMNSDD